MIEHCGSWGSPNPFTSRLLSLCVMLNIRRTCKKGCMSRNHLQGGGKSKRETDFHGNSIVTCRAEEDLHPDRPL